MILFIAFAAALAKLRGFRIKPMFRERSLIPMLIAEIVFWVFQICAWCGEYRFVPYATRLQTIYILTLLWPILKFRLYNHAVFGALMVAAGTFMNKAVMNANGGRMPVYPTVSRLTGYFRDGAMETAGDARHMLMSAETKLRFLGDYIDIGYSIMSPGDILIHGFVTVVVYGVIRELNRKG